MYPIRFLFCLTALTAMLVRAVPTSAQEVRPGFTRLGGAAGLQRYAPGTWGIVNAELFNPTNQPVDLLATTYFEGEPEHQFGRQAWIPAGARRSVWYPIQIPNQNLRESTTVDLKSLLFERSEGKADVLVKPRSGQVLYSEKILLDPGRSLTGFVAGSPPEHSPFEYQDDPPPDMAFEAAVALRLGVKLSRQIVTLRPQEFPPTAESWSGLSNLVIANDSLTSDLAAVSAVRRWLHEGGRLWIMLDRVAPSTVSQILGDDFDCQAVDRVGLNEFEIRDAPPSASAAYKVAVEQPVDLVRIIPGNVEIVHEINGWPASFWKDYGRGRILYTTLAPEGWIRPRNDNDPKPQRPEDLSAYLATEPLSKLAAEFFQPSQPSSVSSATLSAIASDQVGYRIVGRGVVTALLGSFCLALAVVGWWLARRERSEILGWLGPLSALGVASVLVVLGASARQAIPPTVAVTQLAEVAPGANEALVSGTAAVYSPDVLEHISVGSKLGGTFLGEGLGLSGQTQRLISTDIDAFHWEDMTLPAGVSSFAFRTTVPLEEPLLSKCTFGPEGFVGNMNLASLGFAEDALLVTGLGRRVSAKIDTDGHISAGVDDVLTADQYLASAFLSDAQQQRLSAYREALTSGPFAGLIARPTLLAWTKPLNVEYTLPENLERKGTALVTVPITLERPAPGSRVVIPSAFLQIRDVEGPAKLAGSRRAYNFRDGSWTESPNGARTWLRFALPPETVPLQLTKAVLTVQVSAPGRYLEVEGLVGEEPVSFGRHENPAGTYPFEIDRAEVLQLDEQGGLTLSVNVADLAPGASDPRTRGEAENLWKIQYVTLDLYGEIPSP